MENTNYTIAEEFELPSKGLIYDTPFDPMVKLRSMTARDELRRQSPSTQPFKKLATLIDDCTVSKLPISVYDMALGDYEFLLHKLRIVTYGADYNVMVNCPDCNETVEAVANLEDLEVKEFNRDEFESFRNFTLPDCGKQVTIKFRTPHLMEMVSAKTKELKKKFKQADLSFDSFALLFITIDTVNNMNLNELQLENFINGLSAKDMRHIENNLDKLDRCIGLKNEFTAVCPTCGEEIKTFFRFGTEFFRPTNV